MTNDIRIKTLVFLRKPEEGQLLLAMKKRGFGEGKWNGVGGKVEEGETVVEAAARETEEEIGVVVHTAVLKEVARLTFYYEGKLEWDCLVHVYTATTWTGDPSESEEMRPQWYPESSLPFESMWEDDAIWLPRVLSGEYVEATFHFDALGKLAKQTL